MSINSEHMHGISIVIPAYNEENFLPETVASILVACRFVEDKSKILTEVIVVDNRSTDKTADVAAQLGAKVISHDIRNIASVRNAGIRVASYPIVVTVDADTLVPSNAFQEIWDRMQTEKYIGGGVRLGIRTTKTHFRILLTLIESTAVALLGLSGGMFFFWKEAALEIGGFPETHLAAEDMAFAKALRLYGANTKKQFLNLRTVTILTFDRKDASIWQSLNAFYVGVKSFVGAKITKKELEYWYNPKR